MSDENYEEILQRVLTSQHKCSLLRYIPDVLESMLHGHFFNCGNLSYSFVSKCGLYFTFHAFNIVQSDYDSNELKTRWIELWRRYRRKTEKCVYYVVSGPEWTQDPEYLSTVARKCAALYGKDAPFGEIPSLKTQRLDFVFEEPKTHKSRRVRRRKKRVKKIVREME